ncbi:Vitamin-D-receptor interacting Mediator subunit 4 [Rhizoctonia solani]|uniref:Mediator of RNA polymerase II transcription subunit 4 n=1 Tax=Rhizoctonia solani TaxID=456999 RepID=A0A8H7IF81_9AGAM|nr:Vitamin-D-receptor interacting Mediator subunit 4 [Rhizoctonia solani]
MSIQPLEPETTQDLIHAPLTTFETLTHSLFSSLSQSGLRTQTQQQAPHISTFLETDLVLAQALATAREHQANQKLIEDLSTEVLELDEKLRTVWSSLDEAHKELGGIVEEERRGLRKLNCTVPYQQLLNYASILSGFTSAPPTSKGPIGPDQPAPHWIKPPFPNEEKMRAGRLAERPALERVNPKEPENLRSPSVDPVEAAFNPYRHDYQRHQAQMQQEADLLDLDLNPDL